MTNDRAIGGILLVDKAGGPTSHDVVRAVRAILGERRCGHTGTLDPIATGLLPLLIGRATRLQRFVSAAAKTYQAVVRFGYATDTYDITGRQVGPGKDVALDRDSLCSLLDTFVGRQGQVPPPFAAKKVGGQRMYRLARAGLPVEPRPVTVVIRRICLLEVDGCRITLEVEVGSGTYIRSLAHDLGQRLGCGAHLEKLRRTTVGPFSVARAHCLEELEGLARAGRVQEAILDPAEALSELPAIRLGEEAACRVGHGRPLSVDQASGISRLRSDQPCRMLGPGDVFLGVGVADGEPRRLRPVVVLRPDHGLYNLDPL